MLIQRATLADGRTRDVRVTDGQIAAIEPADSLSSDDERAFDAEGYHLLPGMIDCHVHFRQPGDSHKETWGTGSHAAAAGGVTTVVDQPNTNPPTTTGENFDAKRRFTRDSLVDYGVSGGVVPDWEPETLFDRPLFALGEVFLADSTGNMGIDDELFREAAQRADEAGLVVSVHAEDAERFVPDALPGDETETKTDGTSGVASGRDADAAAWSRYRPADAEVAAVETALDAGAETDCSIHIAHTSTPEAVQRVVEARAQTDAGGPESDADRTITCEVTPHHLFLDTDDATELGTYGRMNPPLRNPQRRRRLFDALRDGRVDCVATDHAPHTREEKEAPLTDAPSGVPGVETALPLLLAAVRDGQLDLERVRDVTAHHPARIFGLPNKGRVVEGADADLTLVDLDDAQPIRGDDLHSKCQWTPFEGHEGVFPVLTLVDGSVVYDPESWEFDTPFGGYWGDNVRVSQ